MKSQTEMSKLIARVLRHEPQLLALTVDEHGWCDAALLVERLHAIQPFTMDDLRRIVAEDGKGRYSFSADGGRIRANQGHSIPVDVGLVAAVPPPTLWHGTKVRFLPGILENGLQRRSRLHVHLSADEATAQNVGDRRRGESAILRVDAGQMQADGYIFYLSVNGVWLTEAVPPQYLTQVR